MNEAEKLEPWRLAKIREAIELSVTDTNGNGIIPKQQHAPGAALTEFHSLCWMIDPTEGSHIGDDDWYPADYTDSVDVVLGMIYARYPDWKIRIDQFNRMRPTTTTVYISIAGGHQLHEWRFGRGHGPTIALALLDAYADARIKELEKAAELG